MTATTQIPLSNLLKIIKQKKFKRKLNFIVRRILVKINWDIVVFIKKYYKFQRLNYQIFSIRSPGELFFQLCLQRVNNSSTVNYFQSLFPRFIQQSPVYQTFRRDQFIKRAVVSSLNMQQCPGYHTFSRARNIIHAVELTISYIRWCSFSVYHIRCRNQFIIRAGAQYIKRINAARIDEKAKRMPFLVI